MHCPAGMQLSSYFIHVSIVFAKLYTVSCCDCFNDIATKPAVHQKNGMEVQQGHNETDDDDDDDDDDDPSGISYTLSCLNES